MSAGMVPGLAQRRPDRHDRASQPEARVKILFVHQNFPGQFLHLAPEMQRRGHDCLALTDAVNQRASPIPTVRYKHEAQPVDPGATRLGATTPR